MSLIDKIKASYSKANSTINYKTIRPENGNLVEFPENMSSNTRASNNGLEKINDSQTNSLVSLVIEAWRLKQAYDNLDEDLFPYKVRKRKQNQSLRFAKYFNKYLNDLNLDCVDLTGTKYEPGLPVDPINLDDFNGESLLVIETMIEPVVKVLASAEVLKRGIVVLKEEHE